MTRRGCTRTVVVVGPFALKFAFDKRGRRCNRFEADLFKRVDVRRRAMLCPVLWSDPTGTALLMPAARPLTEPGTRSPLGNRWLPRLGLHVRRRSASAIRMETIGLGLARWPLSSPRLFKPCVVRIKAMPPLCRMVDRGTLPLDRWMPRQGDDAWPAVSIAARTLHVTERHTDRCFWVARFNA